MVTVGRTALTLLTGAALALGCEPPAGGGHGGTAGSAAASAPRYELRIVRGKELGPVMLRFDTATGDTWLQSMRRRADPWKHIGPAPDPAATGPTGRYTLIEAPRGPRMELLRFDTARGIVESHLTMGIRPWKLLDGSKGEIGGVEEGELGRYHLILARTMVGARLVRSDTTTGKTWTMPLSGEGGWLPVFESDKVFTGSDRSAAPRVAGGLVGQGAAPGAPEATDPEAPGDEPQAPEAKPQAPGAKPQAPGAKPKTPGSAEEPASAEEPQPAAP